MALTETDTPDNTRTEALAPQGTDTRGVPGTGAAPGTDPHHAATGTAVLPPPIPSLPVTCRAPPAAPSAPAMSKACALSAPRPHPFLLSSLPPSLPPRLPPASPRGGCGQRPAASAVAAATPRAAGRGGEAGGGHEGTGGKRRRAGCGRVPQGGMRGQRGHEGTGEGRGGWLGEGWGVTGLPRGERERGEPAGPIPGRTSARADGRRWELLLRQVRAK